MVLVIEGRQSIQDNQVVCNKSCQQSNSERNRKHIPTDPNPDVHLFSTLQDSVIPVKDTNRADDTVADAATPQKVVELALEHLL